MAIPTPTSTTDPTTQALLAVVQAMDAAEQNDATEADIDDVSHTIAALLNELGDDPLAAQLRGQQNELAQARQLTGNDGTKAVRQLLGNIRATCTKAAAATAAAHQVERGIIAAAKEDAAKAKAKAAPVVIVPVANDDMLPEIVVTAPRPRRAEVAEAVGPRPVDPVVVAAKEAEFTVARTSSDYTVRAKAAKALADAKSGGDMKLASETAKDLRKEASRDYILSERLDLLPSAVTRNLHDKVYAWQAEGFLKKGKLDEALREMGPIDQPNVDLPDVEYVGQKLADGAKPYVQLTKAAVLTTMGRYKDIFDLNRDGKVDVWEFEDVKNSVDLSWHQMGALASSSRTGDSVFDAFDARLIDEDEFKLSVKAIVYMKSISDEAMQVLHERFGKTGIIRTASGTLTQNDLRRFVNLHGIKLAEVDTDGDQRLSLAEIEAALAKCVDTHKGEKAPAAIPEDEQVTPPPTPMARAKSYLSDLLGVG